MRKRGHMRKTEAMINEIEKVIIGKREVIEQVLMTILAKGHVLLEDIPGVGKTTLALKLCKSHGRGLSPDSCLRRMLPLPMWSDSPCTTGRVESFSTNRGQSCATCFWQMRHRTSSKTQASLLEVMEEGKPR